MSIKDLTTVSMNRPEMSTVETSTTLLVLPAPPTGNARRIELAGIDLWLDARIDNIFVYPSELNIDRFKNALGQTLSRWPLVAGHLLLIDENRYLIEMADHAIPIFIVDNHDLMEWPFGSNVVVEKGYSLLQPYFSFVRTQRLLDCSPYEPLFQMKITHIVQSNQWILGVSWAHILGDAVSCLHFLSTLSCLYQGIVLCQPDPIFERRLWHEKDAVPAFIPMMNLLEDALPSEKHISTNLIDLLEVYAQVNLHFSGEQLMQLHKIAGETRVTIQDALTAYMIVLLNSECFLSDDERIKHTSTIVNYRGVSESIAPLGLVANAVLRMLSEDFDHPQSLSKVAQTIRRSIQKSRDIDFLEPYLATADCLMRRNVREKRRYRMTHYPNEIVVNSNLKYDWADAVNFGCRNQCRFYTTWTGPFYLRVFRSNPMYDGHHSLNSARQGVEVAFLIEKSKKSQLITAWQRDIKENFDRWKTSEDSV